MMQQTFYAVGAIRAEMEVESNLPFKMPFIKLRWCRGQIGALPVFATREEAESFAGESPVIMLRVVNEVTLDSEA